MVFKKKHFKLWFYAFCFCSALFLAGCSDDPASFLDSYSVSLTENEGTSYTGDYFPLIEEYTCNYTGPVTMGLEASYSIPGEGSGKMDTSISMTTSGTLKMLPAQNITLKSGTYALYPLVETVTIDMSELDMSIGESEQAISDTSRYYMKDNDAVYIKALKLGDGNYIEVENPLFIKSTLVVGDSWETAPLMDITTMLPDEMLAESGVSLSDLNMDVKAKFFVAGNESVSVPAGTRTAMKLEQANQISIGGKIVLDEEVTGDEEISINIDVSANLSIIYYLVKDTGIIKQSVTGPITMSISAQGMKVNASITFDTFELGLTDTEGNPPPAPVLPKRKIVRNDPSKPLTTVEKRMIGIAKAIERGIVTGLTF